MAEFRSPSIVSHWFAFCTGTPASDGWRPSARYRVVATAALVLVGANVIFHVADERGLVAAVGLAALLVSAAWFTVRGRNSSGVNYAIQHPYRDASWSIPIAAVFALVLLPESWPLTTVLALGGAYVALIFALAWRGVQRRHQRITA